MATDGDDDGDDEDKEEDDGDVDDEDGDDDDGEVLSQSDYQPQELLMGEPTLPVLGVQIAVVGALQGVQPAPRQPRRGGRSADGSTDGPGGRPGRRQATFLPCCQRPRRVRRPRVGPAP